jgi:hypothetical protein
MANVIEPAGTGRAKCRACGRVIGKGELRFGEVLPNPFGEGETTYWLHLYCAAYKRPEQLLPLLEARAAEPAEPMVADAQHLIGIAKSGIEHHRLPRIAGAERSPTARARCRHCGEPIDKGLWRLALHMFEDGRFQPSGFIHAVCARAYFGTAELDERIRHFSSGLSEEELGEITGELEKAPPISAS